MKKVKFISNDKYAYLTKGEVYNVVKYERCMMDNKEYDAISIINDIGEVSHHHFYPRLTSTFEDVTHHYRNDIIDEILN